jgi:hypothetical protein
MLTLKHFQWIAQICISFTWAMSRLLKLTKFVYHVYLCEILCCIDKSGRRVLKQSLFLILLVAKIWNCRNLYYAAGTHFPGALLPRFFQNYIVGTLFFFPLKSFISEYSLERSVIAKFPKNFGLKLSQKWKFPSGYWQYYTSYAQWYYEDCKQWTEIPEANMFFS